MSTDIQLATEQAKEEAPSLRDAIVQAMGITEETDETQEVEAQEYQSDEVKADDSLEESETEETEFKVREDLESTYNYLKKDEKEFLKESNLPNELVEKYLEKVKSTNSAYLEKTKNFSELRRVIEPFEDSLAVQGITSAQKISQYIAIEKQLLANPVEGLLQLAKSYGVDLEKSLEERQTEFEDPAFKKISELEKKLSDLENKSVADVEQSKEAQRKEALTEVENFKNAKDENGQLKYPLFDKIKLNMSAKFQDGSASNLQDAYEKVTKELGLSHINTPRKSVKEAKAAASVKSKSGASSLTTSGMSLRQELESRAKSAKLL